MPAEDQTNTMPIFCERDIYMVAGFLAQRWGKDIENDNPEVIKDTEDAISYVVSLQLGSG